MVSRPITGAATQLPLALLPVSRYNIGNKRSIREEKGSMLELLQHLNPAQREAVTAEGYIRGYCRGWLR